MNQTAKEGTFSRQKFPRALREEASSLIGSFVLAFMSWTAFDNYQQHHKVNYLFVGWTFAVFFVWAFSFIVRNIVRASRRDETEILASPGISTEG